MGLSAWVLITSCTLCSSTRAAHTGEKLPAAAGCTANKLPTTHPPAVMPTWHKTGSPFATVLSGPTTATRNGLTAGVKTANFTPFFSTVRFAYVTGAPASSNVAGSWVVSAPRGDGREAAGV